MQLEIKNLEDQLEMTQREKRQEMEKAERAKQDYEARIKELEEQINMLKDQSGDLVN